MSSSVNFKEITDNIPQIIWKLDINLNTMYYNTAWKNYAGGFGILSEEVIHNEDIKNTKAAFEKKIPNVSFEIKRRIKNKLGIYHWFLTKGLWINGFCYGTCTNITELIKLKKEKLISDKTCIELAENADVLTMEMVDKNKEQIINKKIHIELLEKSDILALEIVRKDKEKIINEKVHIELLERSDVLTLEILRKNKEKTLQEKEHSELLQKSESLEEHNTELIKAKLIQEELTSFISHEIRNSLSQIININNFLQNTELTKEQKEFTDILENSSEFMLRLINNILDKKLLDFNTMEINYTPCDFFSIIQSVINSTKNQILNKGLKLNVNIPNFLSKVYTNRDNISQILINLIGNATKFTTKGNISIDVKIINESLTYYIINIIISDTGIGIEEDKLNILFNPFTQTSSEINKEYGGNGLGLYICKKILTLMNGSVSVSSIFGTGSAFTVTLPLKKAVT